MTEKSEHMSQERKRARLASFFGRKPAPQVELAPVPRLVPAQVISAVEPVIPARFLAATIQTDQIGLAFWALFTVHLDGRATVAMTESTGHAALDALALDAARRWRFQPATQDGEPVESYLRLKIEFDTTMPISRRTARKEGSR